MPIHFGTDGWRGVISDTFPFHNLRLVPQAIADAVASAEWLNGAYQGPAPDPRRMVVGFDTRFLSDRFAGGRAPGPAATGPQGRPPNLMDYDHSGGAGLIYRFNPTPAYHEHLRSLIDLDAIAENPQH